MINEIPQAQRTANIQNAKADKPSLMDELMGEDCWTSSPLGLSCEEDKLWEEIMMASPLRSSYPTIPQLNQSLCSPPVEEIFNDDQPILVSPKRVANTHAKLYNLQENLSLSTKARSNVVRLLSTTSQVLPVLLNLKTN